MPKLLYGMEILGTHYRLIDEGDFRVIERHGKDALGDPRWDVVTRWNHRDRSTRKPSALDEPMFVVIQMLDDALAKAEALREAHTYEPIEGPD